MQAIKENHSTHFSLSKSGWSGMYHLIIENPEDGDMFYEHHFVDRTDIEERYQFAIKKMNQLSNCEI